MKAKTLIIKKTDKWTIPGESLTVYEFKAGIKEAQKGPFFTIDESKKMIDECRNQRKLNR